MNFKLFFVCLVFCTVFVCGFPNKNTSVNSVKLYTAIDSKTNFSAERLFSVLDSIGGEGTWMEWDINGVKDPSIMHVLQPLLNEKNKPKMVWVLSERIKPLLAVLVQKGSGELILFYELSILDGKPTALSLNKVLNPSVVFRDYKQLSSNEFVHLDKPELKIYATDKMIRFIYNKPDNSPLRFDTDFSKKTFVEKKRELKDYMNFFKYEYSLMLRAFVQSTRAMFNWQAWHWYMDEWIKESFLSEKELESILIKGIKPDMITLFKKKALGGEFVEMRTSGNGFYEMTITNP